MFSWFTRHILRRKPKDPVVVAETVTEPQPFVHTGPKMASSLRTRRPSRRRHGAQHVRRTVRS